MNWLQNLPIRRKLTLVILVSCSVVLTLACGLLAGYERFDFRRALARDMTVLADVLAKNTTAALAFQDENSAHETLQALQAEPYVAAACLYTVDGSRFADYTRSGKPEFPGRPADDGYRFGSGSLALFRPVMLNGKKLGTIYLRADLQVVYGRLRLFGGIAVLVLLGSFAVALVLSSRLQRPISGPILALAETARRIAEGKDYSIRATPHGRDETGLLTDSFNQMLARIGEREHALLQEVAERKSAEDRVQSQLARLELLHQITRAIGEGQDLRSIFQVVTRSLEDRLPVDFCCFCLHDQASTLTVANVSARGALAAELGLTERAQVPVGSNGLSRCLQGNLVYEPDTGQIPFPFPQRLAGAGLRSLVAAPLIVESQIFGVLLAARREPARFSSGECEFLRQLSEHVALAVNHAELYTALQRAYDDLRQTQQTVMQQERLRALGQMASGVAHDINNAISPVAIYTELLLEKEPNLSAEGRSRLETIQRAIDDVAATVARMREFYRQREPQLILAPVDLNTLARQVIELSRAKWSDMPQRRGVMITPATELAVDLPVVMGVESEIREALINLVFNAVDAMPEGGTLTIRTALAAAAATAPGAPETRTVRVEVVDTGVGMDEATRRRCLEPFFTTKGERGTGLGLAMVYGVAQRNGADIEIESSPGRGTTMRLNFSAPTAPTGGPVPAAVAAYAVPARLRILVVDDDPLLINSLRAALESDGHLVTAANGGQAGVNAFRAAQERHEPFAVVFTDLGMPQVDGRKVASAVKEESPATPVILLTGWGQRLVAEDDVPANVDCVLSKPPKLRELREALGRVLRASAG